MVTRKERDGGGGGVKEGLRSNTHTPLYTTEPWWLSMKVRLPTQERRDSILG